MLGRADGSRPQVEYLGEKTCHACENIDVFYSVPYLGYSLPTHSCMLPFLDMKKKIASVSVGEIQASTRDDVGLQVAAGELIEAVQAGNVDAVALCLRMAFKMLEAEPHDEGSL